MENENINDIIIKYDYLVSLYAQMNLNKCINVLELDDLKIFGYIGLLDAIEKFDEQKNVKFETYASIKINGAIIDGIRKEGILSRSMETKKKKRKKLMNTDPISTESLYEQQYNMIKNASSWEELLTETKEVLAEDTIDLNDIVIQNELKEMLQNIILTLPPREQSIIYMYYYQQFTMEKIGETIGVSESRACQLMKKSLNELRDNPKVKTLKEYL